LKPRRIYQPGYSLEDTQFLVAPQDFAVLRFFIDYNIELIPSLNFFPSPFQFNHEGTTTVHTPDIPSKTTGIEYRA
jgi:hypothetical protein